RSLIPHSSLLTRTFYVRAAQTGGDGLPVFFDKTGKLLQYAPAITSPNGKPLIRDRTKGIIEIERVRIGEDQLAIFENKVGAPIEYQLIPPTIQSRDVETSEMPWLQEIALNGKRILVNPQGKVVEVEIGQAGDLGDSGVLLTQNGSLVYYV